jgi:hypothetical protein
MTTRPRRQPARWIAGVHHQQIVIRAGAVARVARELGDQRLDRAGEAQPTLVKRVAGGQHREQVAEAMAGHREEPLIRGDAHRGNCRKAAGKGERFLLWARAVPGEPRAVASWTDRIMWRDDDRQEAA